MAKKRYELGSEEQQAWMDKYTFAPRGIAFLEPGTVGLDSSEISAYNVAKSFYQNYPEVFNIPYVAKKTGLKPEDIKKRLHRLYHDHVVMFVMNPAVSLYGWGLYYWVVKLKDSATEEEKEELSRWFQNKDDICTGYRTEGEFDFFNGNHMRVLDNLLVDVIEPWKNRDYVEYVHLCPVRRDIRESNVNMWDAHKDGFRKFVFGADQIEKLLKLQNIIDKEDFAIISAINNTESIGDMFDFDVLEKLSGLDGKQMKKDLIEIVDKRKYIVPMLYVNYRKLGLHIRFYLVRMFQNVPSYRKAEIVDAFTDCEAFSNIFEFTDSFYDCMLGAYAELTDEKAIRALIEKYGEVEEIRIADSDRQFRRWAARLDEENGYWEECIFTDDFLEDRTIWQRERKEKAAKDRDTFDEEVE